MMWDMSLFCFMTLLLLTHGTCGAVQGAAVAAPTSARGRSPLQKWLYAEWAPKHEMPFSLFARQYSSTHNTSSFLSTFYRSRGSHSPFVRLAGVVADSAWTIKPGDGRHVIVKLDKLSREGRRRAKSALALHCMQDVHIIDDLHMLVYVDSPRIDRVLGAFRADSSGLVPISSLVVLDVYSTPSGARFKLSRMIRVWLGQCGRSRGVDKRPGDDSPTKNERPQWRLSLDVRVAVGKESVVEELLQGAPPDTAVTGCRWSLLSSLRGKGVVRWMLTLSREGQEGETKEKKEEEEERGDVICRCASLINMVVGHPAVRWMEVSIEEIIFLNYRASALVQQGLQNASQPLHPLWDAGIDGAGELIGMADTGLDFDSCFFHDPQVPVAIYPKVDHRHRKVVSFRPCELEPNKKLVGDVVRGHGTHVSGTVAGNMLGNGMNSKYNGVAKGAKIFFTSLGCDGPGDISLPIDVEGVFKPGYDEGARVFSNSWGFYAPSEYTGVEKSIDSLASVHEDMLITFAAGNNPGSGVLAPCRAKNTICVGSHTNSFDSVYQNVVASSSPPGPTYDARVKPDVLCPGLAVTSAFSDGDLSTKQCSTVTLQGTSMATAVLSGSLALIRQHLRQFENTSSPSAALVKALVIHSTVYLGPSNFTGFGRLDLSVFFGPSGVKGWFRDKESLAHHDTHMYSFTAGTAATTPDDMVRVSLVWTDRGLAVEGSTRSLVNDLDLVVVDSTGVVYYAGNGTLDKTNLVEQIRLPPSKEILAGFCVFVYGGDIHDLQKQSYALVVSGPDLKYISSNETVSEKKCANNCSGNGDCIEGSCRCFKGYRFVDCSLCDEEYLCKGHGTCTTEDMKCTCDNDHFADEACSVCKTGWYGPSCSSNCTCSHRGKCNKMTGECTCPKDREVGGSGCFSGPNCEFCCRDFFGDKCNVRSYWCREDGQPVLVNHSAGGYIEINGYGTYPPMLACRWLIEAPRYHVVRLEYLRFDLEEVTDVVQLYNSSSEDTPPLRLDTGKRANGTVFVSPNNLLLILFLSGWSHYRRGFLMRYSFERPNCTVVCAERAVCDEWGGGFCVCGVGHAGWTCDVAINPNNKVRELRAGNARGATSFSLLVNEELPLLLTNLSSEREMITMYVAFAKDSISAERHDGLVLRTAIFNSDIGGTRGATVEEKISVTSTCRYAIINLNHSLKNKDGTMKISFTLLHNASLSSVVNGIARYQVALYLAKGDSAYVHENSSYEGDVRHIRVNCYDILPREVLFVFDSTNQTRSAEKVQNHAHRFALFVAVFFSFLTAIGVVAFFVARRSSRDGTAGDVAFEEIVVLETPTNEGDDNDNNSNNNNNNGHGDDADFLFSSMSQFPLEEVVDLTRPKRHREGKLPHVQLGEDCVVHSEGSGEHTDDQGNAKNRETGLTDP